MDWNPVRAMERAAKRRDPRQRPVPRQSGESAIYSLEYLERTQGPREGADAELWQFLSNY
ncbi:hypothetical protein [Streptomyces rochei]|uniref:hypothetical protein n=1 Tax=Streptomyces rochei TaxID=1928 RepID=UPI0036F58EB0